MEGNYYLEKLLVINLKLIYVLKNKLLRTGLAGEIKYYPIKQSCIFPKEIRNKIKDSISADN